MIGVVDFVAIVGPTVAGNLLREDDGAIGWVSFYNSNLNFVCATNIVHANVELNVFDELVSFRLGSFIYTTNHPGTIS